MIAAIDDCDLWNAIKSMPKGKSPGPDRLPSEVYAAFYYPIRISLLNFLNKIAEDREAVPAGFTEAMVRLIPKKGDLSELGNWRPISLLNTDYKIFATILRNRIAPMADYLISKEQIGFMRGRNIDTNIWLVNQEYMDYQVSKDRRIMIFYDLEKAYDYVNHEALGYILQQRGFCPKFTKLIKCLHDKASARVLTAHGPTDPIARKSGFSKVADWRRYSSTLSLTALQTTSEIPTKMGDNYYCNMPTTQPLYFAHHLTLSWPIDA